MPKHRDDDYSYTMRVITNRRPDGRNKYTVTLPKSIGNASYANREIIGEFRINLHQTLNEIS